MKPGPKPLPGRRQREEYRKDVEDKILTILSMNGRASFTMIGSMLGIGREAAYRRVKALEKKYRIRYLAEIDTEKLGFLKFLIFAKFFDKVPDDGKVKEVVEKLPAVQFAFAITGSDYQYVFYALAETNLQATAILYKLHSAFGEYGCELFISSVFETYGLVPLRDEFIDTLKDRIFKRSRQVLTDKKGVVLQREFAVLKELNKDGATEFAEIDKRYGFDPGRAQYSYHRLLQDGLLKRVTITMDVAIKYVGILTLKILKQEKFGKTRIRLLKNIIEEGEHVDKYALVGDIGTPNGNIFFAPCFEEGDLERYRKGLETIKGVELSTAIVTKRIVGDLCFRKFDKQYSQQVERLEEEYKIKGKEKVDYGVLRAALKPEKEFVVDFKELKNKSGEML